MHLIWTYRDWCSRWPSLGSDEFWRHTVVIPWPWTGRADPEDGEPLYRAVCLVVRPWWLCRYTVRSEQRRYVRWERGLSIALAVLTDDSTDEDFNRAYDGYLDRAGEQPPFNI